MAALRKGERGRRGVNRGESGQRCLTGSGGLGFSSALDGHTLGALAIGTDCFKSILLVSAESRQQDIGVKIRTS